ncbi:MAG: glycosyltransferase [Streptococcaceae bacterium]|jgi:glycosyltransferase involved in cell wall biosynthesis|nr:glycosyltransferase [Streptococcaceae bacterium]
MTTIDNQVAIVVVTYKRKALLQVLFDSYLASTRQPKDIFIVDNDCDPEVEQMCQVLGERLAPVKVTWVAMTENTGGAGGFSKGVELAYQSGAEWIWIMDDDVKILPDALEKLEPWMSRGVKENHRVIQCQRLNYDGSDFYWQYHFLNHLGIPNPIAPAGFKAGETSRKMNTACFEGGLFHRSIPETIGAPDKRFFIYWDDTIYGYLASKITQPIIISDVLMQRTRSLDHFELGKIRKLNSTSDMVRYYIMRNRGFMAKYIQLNGDYNPLVWRLGTLLTLAKEIIRLFITKSFKSGFKALMRGMKDGKKEWKNSDWRPMPPLK